MKKRLSTQERKVQITKAAIKIIGQQGLRAFTVAKVAQEVDVTDGSIFKHFKNKNEIVASVIDHLEEVMRQTIPAKSGDPLKQLGEFLINRIKLLTHQPGIKSLVFSDQLIHAGGDGDLKRIMILRKKAREYIRTCLVDAFDQNLINQNLNIDDVIIIFHGMVMSLLFISTEHNPKIDINDRAVCVWKTFLTMIEQR